MPTFRLFSGVIGSKLNAPITFKLPDTNEAVLYINTSGNYIGRSYVGDYLWFMAHA